VSPSVPAAGRHKVLLHFKVLEPAPKQKAPQFTPQEMLDCMTAVYNAAQIDVVLVPPIETLKLPLLNKLQVGGCVMNQATTQQNELFVHRQGVPVNEICVYFLYGTILSAAGCASSAPANGFPAHGRPAAVVTATATRWTLGHECGHVLGLSDVVPTNRVMLGATARINVPTPVLTQAEVTTIKNSPFTKPPP
jgi:hypothetical protein